MISAKFCFYCGNKVAEVAGQSVHSEDVHTLYSGSSTFWNDWQVKWTVVPEGEVWIWRQVWRGLLLTSVVLSSTTSFPSVSVYVCLRNQPFPFSNNRWWFLRITTWLRNKYIKSIFFLFGSPCDWALLLFFPSSLSCSNSGSFSPFDYKYQVFKALW